MENKCDIYLNYFNGQLLGKWLWALQRHHFYLFLSFGVDNMKNSETFDFSVSTFSDQQLPAAIKAVWTCLKDIWEDKFSKSIHNYTFYNNFSAPRRLTHMRTLQTAVFETAASICMCIIPSNRIWRGLSRGERVGSSISKCQNVCQMSENSSLEICSVGHFQTAAPDCPVRVIQTSFTILFSVQWDADLSAQTSNMRSCVNER